MLDVSELIIHTDGGSRGNPGPAATGIVCFENGQIVGEFGNYLGIATNNEAEYQAFIHSLEWLLIWLKEQNRGGECNVTWKLDSTLVVEQLNRKWKIKEARLAEKAQQCWKLLSSLPITYKIIYVPRKENAVADAVVNQVLDAAQQQ